MSENFRTKYYNNVGIIEPSPEQKALPNSLEPQSFILEEDFEIPIQTHICNTCKIRYDIQKFRCTHCVRRAVEEAHETLDVLKQTSKKREQEVSHLVEKYTKRAQKKMKQIRLTQQINRLEHLREYVEKQRKEMEKEEKKLHALEQIYHCRSRTLQETKENSEGKKKNVRIRVPQESRKIANRLKVRRETLRGVLRRKIRELDNLYPIRCINKNYYSIARLPLPSRLTRENLTKQSIDIMQEYLSSQNNILIPDRSNHSRHSIYGNEEKKEDVYQSIFSALGYVVLVCNLLSHYLSVPLPFKMYFRGSHSWIEDHYNIRHGLHLPRDREGFDDDAFKYVHRAIKLLDDNIRHLCIQTSIDRRLNSLAILPNLHSLCEWLSSDCLGDSRVLEAPQDREIFYPFSSATSSSIIRKEEPDEEIEQESDEEFVVIRQPLKN